MFGDILKQILSEGVSPDYLNYFLSHNRGYIMHPDRFERKGMASDKEDKKLET